MHIVYSFLKDIDYTDTEVDEKYRKHLEQIAMDKGNEYLHAELEKVDPESAEKIHFNNVKRVIRALEFYNSTGFPISKHNELSRQKPSPYKARYICFVRDREELYERINKRVDIMFEKGLVAEVEKLKNNGVDERYTSMQAIGYKEVLLYLKYMLN